MIEPIPSTRPEPPTDLDIASLKRRGFTPDDIDRARRFQRPCTALYGLVGVPGGVSTPKGQGTLLRAFSDEALVVLTRGGATESYKGGLVQPPALSFSPEDVSPAGRGER